MSTATRQEEINNGIVTSWIPFTTAGLSASPECSSALYQVPGMSEIHAFDWWQGNHIPFALQCVPDVLSQSITQGTATRLSIGPFHCPSLYTTATTKEVNAISTSVFCCPSEYDFTISGTASQCISTLKSGSIVPSTVVVSSGTWVSWTTTTITQSGFKITGGEAQGYIFAASTSSASTSPAITTSTTIPANAATAQSTSSSFAHGNHTSSLGTGAIAGIAIGCILIGVAILAAIILFIIRKRRKTVRETVIYHEKDSYVPVGELLAGGTTDIKGVKELAVTNQEHVQSPSGNTHNGEVYELDGRSPAPK